MWNNVLRVIQKIGNPADIELLSTAINDLGHGRLITVLGDFNVGKTTLLNQLTDQTKTKTGPIPTTDDLNFVRQTLDNGEKVQLVDTPGTNSIYLEHDKLSDRIMPRSDLILFVTSADRPMTRFEQTKLENMKKWSKNVVIVLNKVDLLTTGDRERVLSFVNEVGQKTFGHPIHVISASKKDVSGIREFLEGNIQKYSKDETLLGITKKLSNKYTQEITNLQENLKEDKQHILDKIEHLNMLSPNMVPVHKLNEALRYDLSITDQEFVEPTIVPLDESDIKFRSILQSTCLGLCGYAIGFADLIHTGGAISCFVAATSTYSFNQHVQELEIKKQHEDAIDDLHQQKENIITNMEYKWHPKLVQFDNQLDILETNLETLNMSPASATV